MNSFFQFRMEELSQEHSTIKAGYSWSYARKNASRIEKSIAYKELLRQQVDPFIVDSRINQLITSPSLKTDILLKVYKAMNSNNKDVHRLEERVFELEKENRRLKEKNRLREEYFRKELERTPDRATYAPSTNRTDNEDPTEDIEKPISNWHEVMKHTLLARFIIVFRLRVG